MTKSKHVQRHPTYVSQVMEVLVAADDALQCREIAQRLNLSTRLVSSALHSLYRYHAVDVIEGQSNLWWYATPADDRRCRVLKEAPDGVVRASHSRPVTRRRKANERPRRDGE